MEGNRNINLCVLGRTTPCNRSWKWIESQNDRGRRKWILSSSHWNVTLNTDVIYLYLFTNLTWKDIVDYCDVNHEIQFVVIVRLIDVIHVLNFSGIYDVFIIVIFIDWLQIMLPFISPIQMSFQCFFKNKYIEIAAFKLRCSKSWHGFLKKKHRTFNFSLYGLKFLWIYTSIVYDY